MNSLALILLPCTAVAFLRPSLRGHDPGYLGLWQSMDPSLISLAVANYPAKAMLMVPDSTPNLTQDWTHRRDGT